MNGNPILEAQTLTSPTVKVRRLGYLVAIPSIVQNFEMPVGIVRKQVLDWSNKNRVFFNHYSLKLPVERSKRLLTGEIKTEGAAGRYIKTCEELGLVVRFGQIRISKIGKVISALSTKVNPFELSTGQLFIILKSLLEKDYDSLNVLCKILTEKEKDEIEFFQREMQRRLSEKIEMATKMNKFHLVDRLRRRIELIRNWKKAERYYLENIKAPRIEWMLDLKFLTYWNQRTDTILLRDHISKFFEKTIISYNWLENEYPYIFSEFYSDLLKMKVENWLDLSDNEKLKLLQNLIEESMKIFEPGLELGKISANEFFEYSVAKLIQDENVVTPFSKLEEDFMHFIISSKLKYKYIQTVSKVDRGYILKV